MEEALFKKQVTNQLPSNYLNKEYLITVPANTDSLHIDFQVNDSVWLTCMIYDEQHNLRGQFLRAGNSGSLIIHEQATKSSPYTVSGPIHSGTWMIDLALLSHQEIPADDTWCDFAITLNDETKNEDQVDRLVWIAENDTNFVLNQFNQHQLFQHEKKWYKGDFHTHTTYSDGEMSREENINMAQKQQLDFFVATDHNIIPSSWFGKSATLVIPGTEVTSPLGHFNIINPNTSPFVTNRIKDMYTEQGTNEIITQDYGNALVSINHPFLKGCPWLYKDTNLANIDTIEIINDPTYPDNLDAIEQALIAWNILLNDGYKITGIGGSDSHLRPNDRYDGSTSPSLIGDPKTFVYCDGLSANNIINSVRKGLVTVSRGAFIHFTNGQSMPGETSMLHEGTIATNVETDDNVTIEWVVNGHIVRKENKSSDTYSFNFEPSEYNWIRADIRYPDGSLYGFSNPIYFGEKTPKITTWNEIITKM